MRSSRTFHIVEKRGRSGPSSQGNAQGRARRATRGLTAGALAATLLSGGMLATALPASAASGGASVPGSGGADGNVRTWGWMFDDRKSDGTASQGNDMESFNFFAANNPFASGPDTSFTPNAYQAAAQQACPTALARADARKGGTPGTSRVVGIFVATSATPDVYWGSGVINPTVFENLYAGWKSAGYQGVLDAGDGVSDMGAYHAALDRAMAEAVQEARDNGNSSRVMCLALNESEPERNYKLSITTDAQNTFPIAGGTEPVHDLIHASNGGSSIVEKVKADVILNWTGEDGSTKQVTKSKAIANNGDTVSDPFVPGDFGWEVWAGGEYWWDIHVAQQGSMDAPVDTPDRDPRETWDAWLPNPNKDVVGSGEESGDHTYENIHGLSVWPGQKLEYSVGIDLNVPENVREKITSFAVQDSFDANFIPNKTSMEFWDSRDAGNPKPVPKKAYELTWDAASNSFTATFTDEWVKNNILGNTAQGWLTMRFTGQVKDTAPAGSTVKNQAFQIVNGVKIATEVPEVEIPSFTPDKEDLSTDLVDIDKKAVVLGDTIVYRLTMDATPGREELAYNVHKLGMVDDYDEEYLKADVADIRVANKTTGADVTDQFNVQILDGVVYAFAKTIDTELPTGESVAGDPQPANLKAYDEAPINPLTDPIINQDLLGEFYYVTIPTTVIKETDGFVIENQARQNLENSHRQTKIVSNPLKAINPDKDVVITPGGDSIDGSEIPLNSVFNYELNSSELPADRAYGSSQWSFADTFDRVRDSYTGIWAVYANTDVYDGDQLVFKKGDLLANSAGSTKDAHGDLFTVTFDEASYTLTASATQAYFDLINTRLDLAQSFSVYSKMVRIAPSEKVENVATETYNNVDRQTDVVWTKTPESPAIDVEKFTLSEGLTDGDRDTADQAYNIPKKDLKDGTLVGIRVTNTGDVPLRNVTLTDKAHQGLAGTVKDIVCVDGISEIAPDKIGDLAVGESIDCQGTLTGVKDGQLHGDTATATGESIYTGKKVTDEDPWFASTPGALAQTGGGLNMTGVIVGSSMLALAGAAFLAAKLRRRDTTSTVASEVADN